MNPESWAVESLASDVVRDIPDRAPDARQILGRFRRGEVSAEAASERLEAFS